MAWATIVKVPAAGEVAPNLDDYALATLDGGVEYLMARRSGARG